MYRKVHLCAEASLKKMIAAVVVCGSALLSAPAPAAAQVSCSGVPAWKDCCGCTYTAGQRVVYGSPSARFHALQTFRNTCGAGWTPKAATSLWARDGSCPTPTPTTRPTPTATATATTRPSATAPPRSSPTATPTVHFTPTPTRTSPPITPTPTACTTTPPL